MCLEILIILSYTWLKPQILCLNIQENNFRPIRNCSFLCTQDTQLLPQCTAAPQWGDVSPGCFNSCIQVNDIFSGLMSVVVFPTNSTSIFFWVQVRWDCWPVKHCNILVIEPDVGTFVIVGGDKVLLGNLISISIKLDRMKFSDLAVACIDCGLQKTRTSKLHTMQIPCLCTLPPDFTPWFLNEMQNLFLIISNISKTLEQQFSFSLL